jgi:hypothetical protein
LTKVDFIGFGNRKWYFDTPFASGPSGLEPVLEISINGVVWFSPNTLVSSTANTVEYKYPLGGWSGFMCRILSQPTAFDWLPSLLTVPVEMDSQVP